MANKNQDEKNCPVCGGCIPCGRCTCSKDDIIAAKDKELVAAARALSAAQKEIEKLNDELLHTQNRENIEVIGLGKEIAELKEQLKIRVAAWHRAEDENEKLKKEKDRMWKQNELTDFYISKQQVREAINEFEEEFLVIYPKAFGVWQQFQKSLNLSQQEEE